MSFIRIARVKSWLKNVLIFIPLVFGGVFTWNGIFCSMLAFLSFSLVSSGVYIFNDLRDIENDRMNPEKYTRPLASGDISPLQGIFLSLGLIFSGMTILMIGGVHTDKTSVLVLLFYIAINFAYSMGLKQIPLVDIFILASGFMLRVFFGAAVLGMDVSSWIVLTVFSGSLYLAMGKRRNELEHYGALGRKVLEFYTVDFLDKNMQVFMALCLVFYSLACVSDETVAASMGIDLTWTVPLVAFICLRYNFDISSMSEGDPVSVIFKDKWLLGLILFYMASVTVALYFGNC